MVRWAGVPSAVGFRIGPSRDEVEDGRVFGVSERLHPEKAGFVVHQMGAIEEGALDLLLHSIPNAEARYRGDHLVHMR